MSDSMVSKNYLLRTKISFLTISFVIGILGIMVRNDTWPFLQMTLPAQSGYDVWALSAILIASLLMSVWLCIDWSKKNIRYGVLSILSMLWMQLITEFAVAYYFFVSMVIPVAMLYVGYRIIQFIDLQRVLNKTSYPSRKARAIRVFIVGLNLLFWTVLWLRLTVVLFPQIIYQV